MISLEGKSFNITKSLPVSPEKILLSKVLTSNIISIPVILICDIIFFIVFKVAIIIMGSKINLDLFIILELVAFSIIVFTLWKILKKYGAQKFKAINV